MGRKTKAYDSGLLYLELDELGSPGLEVQPAAALVHPAVVGRAADERHERGRPDRLVRLAAALVARVGGHLRKVKFNKDIIPPN